MSTIEFMVRPDQWDEQLSRMPAGQIEDWLCLKEQLDADFRDDVADTRPGIVDQAIQNTIWATPMVLSPTLPTVLAMSFAAQRLLKPKACGQRAAELQTLLNDTVHRNDMDFCQAFVSCSRNAVHSWVTVLFKYCLTLERRTDTVKIVRRGGWKYDPWKHESCLEYDPPPEMFRQ